MVSSGLISVSHHFEQLMTKPGKSRRYAAPALQANPDSKVHGANMGPTWGRQDPGGPHVGHQILAFWVKPMSCPLRWWFHADRVDRDDVMIWKRLSALLTLCEGNLSVTDGFPSQSASNVDRWCFFIVSPNNPLNKRSGWRWYETSCHSCDPLLCTIPTLVGCRDISGYIVSHFE